MKILSAGQIREIDAKTIQYEGISSLELMKRAAVAFYDWFIKNIPTKTFPSSSCREWATTEAMG